MRHAELVRILLNDFVRMFPDADAATRGEVYGRLVLMNERDLELLVTQVKEIEE